MSSRWRKVWADFWGNKTRTFLMILTIAVGVFAVGFNSTVGRLMNRDMDADFLSANPSEAIIYASPLDDELVAASQRVPGVEDAEGRRDVSAQLLMPDGKKISIQFTAMEDAEEWRVNRLKPADPADTTLPPLGDREVLLDRSASGLGFQPGDILTIELTDGKIRRLHFGGYVHDVTGFPYSVMDRVSGFVTPDTLEWLGGPPYDTQLLVSVAEKPTDHQHVANVAQAVADRLEKGGAQVWFILVYNPGHHFAWEVTQGVIFVLGALGYMTVFLSAFLVVNTIVALMSQHTRQIGIMKAIGGGTRQIFSMYVVLILSFGAAALAGAVPLAAILGMDVLQGLASWLNFDPGPLTIFPETVIEQAIVALVVPLGAALLPMWKSVRTTVHAALSDYGLGSANGVRKPASAGKGARLLPRPVRISLRNAFRKRARLALTLFTLVLGGAIFIAVMNLYGSFDRTMKDIEGYFLADINVEFTRAYRFDKVAPLARSVPGVERAEGWMFVTAEIVSADRRTSNELGIVAPPADSTLIKPLMTAGRWLTSGDENAIVIGNHLLNVRPDLKVGDWVTIIINDKETEWRVIGIYRLPGNIVPPLVYTNYEYLSRLVNEPGQVSSLRVITGQHDQPSAQAVRRQLEELFGEKNIPIGNITLASEWRAQQTSQTDVLVYFMLVMAVLTAVVGGLGLMGTMSINVLERTREIGVMRAIGASNGDIQWIVLVEGLVIGLLSWLSSIALSIPFTSVLTTGVGVAIFKAPLPVVYGLEGIFVWLFGTLIIAVLASALPARRASRLTVRDTLAYE